MEYVVRYKVIEDLPMVKKVVEADSRDEALKKVCDDYGIKESGIEEVRRKGAIGFIISRLGDLKESDSKHAFSDL